MFRRYFIFRSVSKNGPILIRISRHGENLELDWLSSDFYQSIPGDFVPGLHDTLSSWEPTMFPGPGNKDWVYFRKLQLGDSDETLFEEEAKVVNLKTGALGSGIQEVSYLEAAVLFPVVRKLDLSPEHRTSFREIISEVESKAEKLHELVFLDFHLMDPSHFAQRLELQEKTLTRFFELELKAEPTKYAMTLVHLLDACASEIGPQIDVLELEHLGFGGIKLHDFREDYFPRWTSYDLTFDTGEDVASNYIWSRIFAHLTHHCLKFSRLFRQDGNALQNRAFNRFKDSILRSAMPRQLCNFAIDLAQQGIV